MLIALQISNLNSTPLNMTYGLSPIVTLISTTRLASLSLNWDVFYRFISNKCLLILHMFGHASSLRLHVSLADLCARRTRIGAAPLVPCGLSINKLLKSCSCHDLITFFLLVQRLKHFLRPSQLCTLTCNLLWLVKFFLYAWVDYHPTQAATSCGMGGY